MCIRDRALIAAQVRLYRLAPTSALPPKETAALLRVRPFVVEQALRGRPRYTPRQLRQATQWCAQADWDIKQGKQKEDAAVEDVYKRQLRFRRLFRKQPPNSIQPTALRMNGCRQVSVSYTHLLFLEASTEIFWIIKSDRISQFGDTYTISFFLHNPASRIQTDVPDKGRGVQPSQRL